MSHAPQIDPKAAVSCVDCLNALFHCFGPAHQFDRYYKDGRIDECQKRLDELKFCMKLKLAGPEEAKGMVRQLLKEEVSPTVGVIWQPRPAESQQAQLRQQAARSQ